MGTGRIFGFSQSHPLLRGTCCNSVIAPQRACIGSRPTSSATGTVTRWTQTALIELKVRVVADSSLQISGDSL